MSFRRMRHVKAREIQGCQLAVDAGIPSSLYDATTGGALVAANGTVARLEDQSGNARHATNGMTNQMPLRKVAARKGKDALLFDGSNDELLHGATSGSDPNTIVFVGAKKSSQSGYRGLISYGVNNWTSGAMLLLRCSSDVISSYGSADLASTFTPAVDEGFVVSQVSTSTATDWRANNASAGSASGNAISQGPHIGGDNVAGGGAQSSNIYLHEAAIWNLSMPTATRARLDTSRARKWSIPT